jgi:hypothetical protein
MHWREMMGKASLQMFARTIVSLILSAKKHVPPRSKLSQTYYINEAQHKSQPVMMARCLMWRS